jgi:hypothetical protein
MPSPNACSTHATPADGSWNAAPNSAVTNASGMAQTNGKTRKPKARNVQLKYCFADQCSNFSLEILTYYGIEVSSRSDGWLDTEWTTAHVFRVFMNVTFKVMVVRYKRGNEMSLMLVSSIERRKHYEDSL